MYQKNIYTIQLGVFEVGFFSAPGSLEVQIDQLRPNLVEMLPRRKHGGGGVFFGFSIYVPTCPHPILTPNRMLLPPVFSHDLP